jgi:phage tail sheath protein FI
MRKVVTTASRAIVFEPNDEDTWAAFKNLVEPLCRDIKSRRGLYDFRVICDATTNTAAVINKNEMRGKILMKPTKTAEMITIDFTILNNAAQFSEF